MPGGIHSRPRWRESGSKPYSPWALPVYPKNSSILPDESEGTTPSTFCVYHASIVKTAPVEAPAGDTEKRVLATLETLSRRLLSNWQEATRLAGLERELASLKSRIAALEFARTIIVPVQTLSPEPFEVMKPFQVVLESRDPEYVATFFDAEISASGENESEAIANLKDIMIATYEMLLGHDAANLGPGPKTQLKVLKEFIRKAP